MRRISWVCALVLVAATAFLVGRSTSQSVAAQGGATSTGFAVAVGKWAVVDLTGPNSAWVKSHAVYDFENQKVWIVKYLHNDEIAIPTCVPLQTTRK